MLAKKISINSQKLKMEVYFMRAKRILALLAAGLFTAVSAISVGADDDFMATSNVKYSDVTKPKFSCGVFQVSDAEFEVQRGKAVLLSDDNNVIMLIPGGGPAVEEDADGNVTNPEAFNDKIQQNPELWQAIDSITVRFIMTKEGGKSQQETFDIMKQEAEDEVPENQRFKFDWMQTYIQGGKMHGWEWTDAMYVNQDYMAEFQPEAEGGPVPYGEEMEVTFDIKKYYEDAKEKGLPEGGILKIGFKAVNELADPEYELDMTNTVEPTFDKYKVEFTGMSIMGDEAIINKYAELAKTICEDAGHLDKYEPIEEFVKPNVPLEPLGDSDTTPDTSDDSKDDSSTDDSSKDESKDESKDDSKDESKEDGGAGAPWGLIGGIVAGIVVIGVIGFIVVKKGRK